MPSPYPLLKPVLKWAGGKRWLVPKLRELWQPYCDRRLVEPFVGSMSVTLGLLPQQALLCDQNIHVINLCQWLQRGLIVDLEMANEASRYYELRDRFNHLTLNGQHQTIEAAQIFYYLNRTGFNGLCRFNRKGMFNVPFGRYKVINYTRDFSSYAPVLRPWSFIAADFCHLQLHPNDFIYADPPYDVEFTKYSADDFRWEDQVRLAEWLALHPGPVVASNQATDRILELYERLGFSIQLLEGPRRISCTGDRTPALEMLACKGF
ncbi:MAG TPA: Dam family site-specific DNA-(adenine-N6)-methyltransferase [Synechococcales cyanobacterium M55_K2018_004]|nr:Dam family site-specific DNA-(adenine-N6)-methyltransferase [Synechococcales cyanobacterium M55_K2018_004]